MGSWEQQANNHKHDSKAVIKQRAKRCLYLRAGPCKQSRCFRTAERAPARTVSSLRRENCRDRKSDNGQKGTSWWWWAIYCDLVKDKVLSLLVIHCRIFKIQEIVFGKATLLWLNHPPKPSLQNALCQCQNSGSHASRGRKRHGNLWNERGEKLKWMWVKGFFLFGGRLLRRYNNVYACLLTAHIVC